MEISKDIINPTCESVVHLEETIKNSIDTGDIQNIDLVTTHHFSKGMYVRQLDIPQGIVIVGKRHRGHTLNILSKGKMVIVSGTEKLTVEAPYTFTSEPYTKKAMYALEDSSFMNVHITDSTDINEIENTFIIPEEEFTELVKLGLDYNSKEELIWLG